MAVGAGSIKRASKLNTEAATAKKTVEATQEEQKVTVPEVQTKPKKGATAPAKAAKKETTAKTTTRKAPAKKTTQPKAAETKSAEAVSSAKAAPTAEPQNQKKGNEVCHLTEEMPVYLL